MSGYWYYDYRRYDNQQSLRQLLSKGPVVAAMNASVRGFMSYRPKSFVPFTPTGTCGGRINHAVLIVGNVVENGKEYWIGRNSWGTSWGYRGHFKIPVSNDCLIHQRGWSPKFKCSVPKPKPEPKPDPPKPDPNTTTTPKPDPKTTTPKPEPKPDHCECNQVGDHSDHILGSDSDRTPTEPEEEDEKDSTI